MNIGKNIRKVAAEFKASAAKTLAHIGQKVRAAFDMNARKFGDFKRSRAGTNSTRATASILFVSAAAIATLTGGANLSAGETGLAFLNFASAAMLGVAAVLMAPKNG